MQPLFFTQSSRAEPKLRIVLLHGLGGESSVWDELRQQLESALPVETIAFDLAGQGQSSREYLVEELSVIAQANQLTRQLEQLPPMPTVLIGHCFGSLVALAASHQLPNVCEIILISTGSQLPILGWLANSRFSSVCSRLCAGLHAVLPSTHRSGRRDFSADIDSGQFSLKRVIADIMHTSLATYVVLLWEAAKFPAGVYLQKITVRTRIFQGQKDRIFPIQHLRFVVAANRHIQLTMVPEAHHVLVLQSLRTDVFTQIEAECAAVLRAYN